MLTHCQEGLAKEGADHNAMELLDAHGQTADHLYQAQQQELTQDVTTAQGLSLYIPLEGAHLPVRDLSKAQEQGLLFPLQERIDHFLHQDNPAPLLLLQGMAGAGKSLYGRYLEQHLWDTHDPRFPLPLFLSLTRNYAGPDTIATALSKRGFDAQALEELQAQQRFVLILDGFDEVKEHYDRRCDTAGLPRNLYHHLQLDTWRVKTLVSLRSGTVSEAELPHYFNIPQDAKAFVPLAMEEEQKEEPLPAWRAREAVHLQGIACKQVHLAPFSNEKIEGYLRHFAASRYQQALDRLAVLREMVCEPFSLVLTLRALPALVARHGAHAQVYAAFSDSWFHNELAKLGRESVALPPAPTLYASFDHYSQALGWEMFMRSTQVFRLPEADHDRVWQRFYAQQEGGTVSAHMRLQGSPLRRVGAGEYMFIHKSYQEYFAAQLLLAPLLALAGEEEPWQAMPGHSMLGPASSALWQMLAVVERSKEEEGMACAAANALSILNAAGVNLSRHDFRGIHVAVFRRAQHTTQADGTWQGPNLQGGIFEGTDFSGADLRGTLLKDAFLASATLQGAQLEGVNFGRLFDLRGHTSAVWSVAFSPDGQRIATASYDHTVKLWDAATGELQAPYGLAWIGGPRSLFAEGAVIHGALGLTSQATKTLSPCVERLGT